MLKSNPERQQKKEVKISTSTPSALKKIQPVRVAFYEDKDSERIHDVGAACLPSSSSSQEPFLNSFIAFFHKKRGLTPASEETETVPTLTYAKDLSFQDDEEKDEEDEDNKEEEVKTFFFAKMLKMTKYTSLPNLVRLAQ